MIIKGPYPDVTIPKTALTPFVLHRVTDLSDKPALIEGPTGRTVTYQQLADSISIAAHNLKARGFKKGEVFGILSPNCPEYAIAFHAVATLGGIVTPINPLYTRYEIAHQLKDSGARFLVTVPGCCDKVDEAAQEDLLRRAYDDAGVDPSSIDYVELHGTGTKIGDPVETRALGAVIGAKRAASLEALEKMACPTSRDLIKSGSSRSRPAYRIRSGFAFCKRPATAAMSSATLNR